MRVLVRKVGAAYSHSMKAAPKITSRPATLQESVEKHLREYFAAHHEGQLPPSGLYDRVMPVLEKPLIEMTLRATKGNQIKAARVLGINRNTLRKKIKQLGISLSRIAGDV